MDDGANGAPRRAVAAWVLYDWAYGAFTTIVSTFVFATYFTQAVATDPATGASQWAIAQSVAGVLIAVLSVPLGALADRAGRRRLMFGASTAIMIAATLALWTVRPHGDALRALVIVVVGTVAFEIATVFYNAMLPELVSPRHLGRLSGLAWGAGYAGGLVSLFICLTLFISPDPPLFGLSKTDAEPVRATALFAGLWLLVFSWPAVVFVPERGARGPWRAAIREGAAELWVVVRDAIRRPGLRGFLLARIFYMDGLTTLFAFGGIYAAGQFGLDAREVLLFGIGLTVTAGIGAAIFAFAEDRIGAKTTVMIAVCAMAAIGTVLLFLHDRTLFWAFGLTLGIFVGPAQAASRSLMARIAPSDERGAYFGLFALSGRVTGFLGPLALGLVTALFHSQRAGMAVIVVFLALGAALLAPVPSPTAPPPKVRLPRADR